MEPRGFDEAVLEALGVGAKITDGACPGLTARRLKGGVILEWRGRVAGRKATVRLGRWPQMPLATARRSAAAMRAKAAAGGDPRGRRPSGPTSVAAALEQYDREHLIHKRTRDKTVRDLKRYLRPVLAWPVEGVGRAELKGLVEPFAEAGAWGAAYRARALLWAFMRWAEAEELVERAPGRMRLGARKPERSYVIPLADCRSLFDGARALRARHRAFVRVLMLSGLRRGEVAGLRPEEVQDGRIVLGAERTKAGRDHVVPITAGIAAELPALLVGRKPVGSLSRIKARLERASGVEGWRWHDFRRAFSTHMNDMGADPRVVERGLGHAVGGVEGIYNRAKLLSQMREVLEAWEALLCDDQAVDP